MELSYQGHATVQHFERNRLIGTQRIYCAGGLEAGNSFSAYWPHIAHCCPACGEIWAREVYLYEFSYSPRVEAPWSFRASLCPSHGGALYDSVRLDSASPELIRHLFNHYMSLV